MRKLHCLKGFIWSMNTMYEKEFRKPLQFRKLWSIPKIPSFSSEFASKACSEAFRKQLFLHFESYFIGKTSIAHYMGPSTVCFGVRTKFSFKSKVRLPRVNWFLATKIDERNWDLGGSQWRWWAVPKRILKTLWDVARMI